MSIVLVVVFLTAGEPVIRFQEFHDYFMCEKASEHIHNTVAKGTEVVTLCMPKGGGERHEIEKRS